MGIFTFTLTIARHRETEIERGREICREMVGREVVEREKEREREREREREKREREMIQIEMYYT